MFRVVALVMFMALPMLAEGNGYGYFGLGGVNSGRTPLMLQYGGGGEFRFGRFLGAGAEIGAISPARDFSATIGQLSPNAYFHIPVQNRKFDPFVTGGYTMFFRRGVAHGGNFGGGVNYWFGQDYGVRFEFRDQVFGLGRGNVNYWTFRIGLVGR